MISLRRRGRGAGGILLCLAWLTAGAVAAAPALGQPVRILAAFTLKPALDEIIASYRGGEIQPVYGPSPTLAKQIENGLPADLFFSADAVWMDEVARHHLIRPGTAADLVGNRLVLIAPKGAKPVVIAPGFSLARLVGAGPLVMCDPDSHPAGRYAKASLVKLGIWRSVEKKVASVDNPLVAVKNVARGDAPMAVVFATDALTDPAVAIIGTFPPDTHPRIVYPVAILAQSRNPGASAFLDYLKSPAATAVFRRLGYTIPSG